MADKDVSAVVDGIIARMSPDEKIGQCFTFHWGGSMITPYLLDAITKLHCGGLRVSPFGQNSRRGKHYHQALKYDYPMPAGYEPSRENYFTPGPAPYITPAQYADRVNKLQEIATARPSGVPLHLSIDQEGDISHDFPFGGTHLFCAAMGLTATGDPKMAYEVCKATGRQLAAIGMHFIHSPVLDVNLNPRNPEIHIRSYGDDPQVVAEYALASMKGYQDGGLIPVAKHFPGRGDSAVDVHYEVEVLDVDRKRLDEVELYPYQVLIEGGLESIMLAHAAYTALDASKQLATLSKPIIEDVLRGDLGFEGVVTTDSITMGALMQKYGIGLACAMALEAGADLVLSKTEDTLRDFGWLEVKKFVDEGRIREADLDAKVRRILTLKARRGLLASGGKVDAAQADAPIRDKKVIELSRKAAERSCLVLRDEQKLLPLKPDAKVLVIEQLVLRGYAVNDVHCHQLMFNEFMMANSPNVIGMDTQFAATDDDRKWVFDLAAKADVIVATNYYWRLCPANNTELIRDLLAAGKKVIVVTNVPYELGAVPEAGTVICTFGLSPDNVKVAADMIFGKCEGKAVWPLKNYALPVASRPLDPARQAQRKKNVIDEVVF